MKTRLTALLCASLLLFSLAACRGGKTPDTEPAAAEAALTDLPPAAETPGNARVFYEIFVGSFSDSDGDGTGDLRGVMNRLDYLNDGDPASGRSLGVGGIWLTPIFSSPSYHKYDVTDYYAIDPAFGDEETLAALFEACHARDIKVILDLPINHTGRLNKWFSAFVQAHRSGDETDPYYNFYCWRSEDDPAPRGRTYAKIAGTDHLYECNFSEDMPEPDFDRPEVREAMLDIAKHYLALGADGFRFDAAKYIYFGDNAASAAFWKWYVGELEAVKPDLFTVAEVWDGDGVTELYEPAVNCFDFTASQANGLIAETAKAGSVDRYTAYTEAYVSRLAALRGNALFTPFITNHDMDRAAGFLTAANGQIKAAANLYLLGPGAPFIYYGEELGLRGSRGGAQTDANRRLAMPWGDGDTVRDPEGATYGADKQTAAPADEQRADAESLYSYYKKAIALRRAFPAIAAGAYKALALPDTKLGGFVSTLNGETVCVVHNTTTRTLTAEIPELAGFRLAAALGTDGTAELNGTALTLGGQTSAVFVPAD